VAVLRAPAHHTAPASPAHLSFLSQSNEKRGPSLFVGPHLWRVCLVSRVFSGRLGTRWRAGWRPLVGYVLGKHEGQTAAKRGVTFFSAHAVCLFLCFLVPDAHTRDCARAELSFLGESQEKKNPHRHTSLLFISLLLFTRQRHGRPRPAPRPHGGRPVQRQQRNSGKNEQCEQREPTQP
jgi:hypothetical protein